MAFLEKRQGSFSFNFDDHLPSLVRVVLLYRVSLLVTYGFSNQGDHKFDFWWLHWVQNKELNRVAHTIYVYKVPNESKKSDKKNWALGFAGFLCLVWYPSRS